MKTKLLSIGNNRKLSKSVACFNLPPGETCPGKTPVCEKLCYAQKSQRLYKGARDMRARNLEASKQPDFFDRISKELVIAMLKGTVKTRLHEAGDFYSQGYLDTWIHLAQCMPNMKFLAYTKSFHLDFSQVPPNMIIYWSTDASNKGTEPKNGREAYLVQKGEPIPASFVTCDQAGQKSHYCGNICTYCFLGKNNVYFIQH